MNEQMNQAAQTTHGRIRWTDTREATKPKGIDHLLLQNTNATAHRMSERLFDAVGGGEGGHRDRVIASTGSDDRPYRP